MIFPNLCVDNFFDHPDDLVTFANTLSYSPDNTGHWPGVRCPSLNEINYNLYNKICTKILALYYPDSIKSLAYRSSLYFQKIPDNLKYDGWVHTDDTVEMTALIYLSKHLNSGTSIYKAKNLDAVIKNGESKWAYLRGENIPEKKIKKAKEENNNQFYKTIEYNSIYNRIITFDGSQYHAAETFNNKSEDGSERLTLICFFYQISHAEKQIQYPIPTSKRIIL